MTIRSFVCFLCILGCQLAQACGSVPPPLSLEAIVQRADGIYLVRVSSVNIKGLDNATAVVSLEVRKALKGSAKGHLTIDIPVTPSLEFPGLGFYEVDHDGAIFWEEKIGNSHLSTDCTYYPKIEVGAPYLWMSGVNDSRAFERIQESDDMWLLAVKSVLDGSERPIITMREFLNKKHSVFVGQCPSRSGSKSYELVEVLSGESPVSVRPDWKVFDLNCIKEGGLFFAYQNDPRFQVYGIPVSRDNTVDISILEHELLPDYYGVFLLDDLRAIAD